MRIEPAPEETVAPARMTAERYFALVDDGTIGPDDRVELLEISVDDLLPER